MPLTHRLEPQVSTQRDLSSPDLWLRSLERSRHRREIAELDRRYSGRRKSISAVVSAAMLASPVLPRFAVAQEGSSGSDRTEQPADGQPAVMLRLGSTGAGVSALQQRLGGLAIDGIFGPRTAAGVREFQARHGLEVTGVVDMETWAALFGSSVSFLDETSPQAQEIMARGRQLELAPPPTLADARAASARADTVAAAIAPTGPEPAAPADATRRQPRALTEGAAAPRPASLRAAAPTPAPGPPASRPTAPARPAPARPAPASAPTAGDGPCTPGQFVSPVSKYSVSGTFGEDRGDHVHTGLDMVVPYGTPIHAASCGRVTDASPAGGYGNLVCIRHAGGFSTCYAHLSRYGVSAGQYVRVGQIIGYVGCTGSCTGPHLHYEVRYNGVARDPSPYLRARSASASRSTSASRTRASKATVRSTPVSPPESRRSAAVTSPAASSESAPAQAEAASEPAAAREAVPGPDSGATAAAGPDAAPGSDGAAAAHGADGGDGGPVNEPAATEAAPAPEASPSDASGSTPPPRATPEPASQASVASDTASQDASPPPQTSSPGPADEAPAVGGATGDRHPIPEPETPAVEVPKPSAVEAEADKPAAAAGAAATSAQEQLADTATTAAASAAQAEAAASARGGDGSPAVEAEAPAAPSDEPSPEGR